MRWNGIAAQSRLWRNEKADELAKQGPPVKPSLIAPSRRPELRI